MIRLVLACAIALAFPADPGFAQPAGGREHSDEIRNAGDRSSIDNRVDEMHERIDRTESLSDQDKERLHQTVDTANTEMDKVREASARLDRLRAEELAAKDDPARKAEIETETKRELDRLETGRASLTDLRRNLESEIESSESLTREQKTEINTILREFAEGRITQREAESQLGESRILQNEAFYLLIALVTIGVIHFVIESNRGGG